MEIPVNAQVHCADGTCGRSTHVVINLASQQVTYLVVNVKGTLPLERLVPIELVVETAPRWIRLCCTRDDLDSMAPFTEIEWSPLDPCHYAPLLDEHLVHKLLMRPHFGLVKRVRIPPGELAVQRGARVKAADGREGRVERLLVDPMDWRIVYLVLRTGHPWNSRLVSIPFTQIDRIKEDVIAPILDKPAAEALTTI
jgi:sporulation protein YlmC with PRC-barrel domain